ncbi:hypothetical protein MRB53_040414 [Persea americana]|nr:hypothetical protein MRB53_040414 [Persea americana]
MAPPGSLQTLLSPAELSFLHSSLSLQPPIRPDLRKSTQFRPLTAETDILPTTNGSARICYNDGTEAIVGVKAELEKTATQGRAKVDAETMDDVEEGNEHAGFQRRVTKAANSWLETSVEVPGFRDDDSLPIFLGALITEALLSSGTLQDKLWINERWHWKLYIDVLLLSPPLSYPLPLLSLTTHMALLSTSLPRLISEPSDDPLFDDDWAAAVPLYAKDAHGEYTARPPATLLVMTVGTNILFDPSKDELAVAESVIAVSFIPRSDRAASSVDDAMKIVAVRMVDPPSRLTPPGIPDAVNPATLSASAPAPQSSVNQEALSSAVKGSVWNPPRGGMKRSLLAQIVKMVTQSGGVGEEVLEGLAGVET